MKVKLSVLLLALFVLASSSYAGSYYWIFDDPGQPGTNFLLDSAARTATTNTIQFPQAGETCVFVLNVTAGATLLLQVSPQFFDPGLGVYMDIFNPNQVTGTGRFVYVMGPQHQAAGEITLTQLNRCPPVLRVRVVHGNANSATYSLSGFSY